DGPEAQGGEQHRHARVVEAAQGAAGRGLDAVGEEEARPHDQERGGERHRLGRLRRLAAEEATGMAWRISATTSVMAPMNVAASVMATKPARRVPTGSRRPTA